MAKKHKSPLQMVSDEVDRWIKKTEDPQAIYPLQAVKEIIKDHFEQEEIFAGKMYDYGASAKYGYETGRKFYNDKIK